MFFALCLPSSTDFSRWLYFGYVKKFHVSGKSTYLQRFSVKPFHEAGGAVCLSHARMLRPCGCRTPEHVYLYTHGSLFKSHAVVRVAHFGRAQLNQKSTSSCAQRSRKVHSLALSHTPPDVGSGHLCVGFFTRLVSVKQQTSAPLRGILCLWRVHLLKEHKQRSLCATSKIRKHGDMR